MAEVVLGNGPVDVERFLETGAQPAKAFVGEFDVGLLPESTA